ncbi:hypothetical protein ACWGS9_14540 [Bradyrhizobium sp. Arg314]
MLEGAPFDGERLLCNGFGCRLRLSSRLGHDPSCAAPILEFIVDPDEVRELADPDVKVIVFASAMPRSITMTLLKPLEEPTSMKSPDRRGCILSS